MAFMHMSSQLFRLLIHLLLEIEKRLHLDQEDFIELDEFFTILADCHAPLLGRALRSLTFA